jgi:uncharacterized membrane protein YesL
MSILNDRNMSGGRAKKLDTPVPQEGARRYFFLLRTHFGKIILLNLLFVAFSIPVVTLPAAICGANRVWTKLICEGNCFLWHDFIKEFKASFAKSLLCGSVFGAGLFAAHYLLSLSLTNGQTVFGMLFFAAGLFIALLTFLMAGWVFALIAMLPLKTADILKNARALAVLERGRSAGIIGVSVAACLFALIFMPISLVFIALCLPAFAQYTICFFAYEAADKHIIQPYCTLSRESSVKAL